jgi:hypothetical protein
LPGLQPPDDLSRALDFGALPLELGRQGPGEALEPGAFPVEALALVVELGELGVVRPAAVGLGGDEEAFGGDEGRSTGLEAGAEVRVRGKGGRGEGRRRAGGRSVEGGRGRARSEDAPR